GLVPRIAQIAGLPPADANHETARRIMDREHEYNSEQQGFSRPPFQVCFLFTVALIIASDERGSNMTDASSAGPETLAKRVSGWSIVLSILLMVFGVLAILLPVEMSFGVVVVLAWTLMISGFFQFLHAFRSQGVGSAIWKTLIALVYVATGVYLRLNLGIGVAALTLLLIGFFVVQGVIDIFVYLTSPKIRGSGWVLFDGVIMLILGLLIW